MTEKNPIQAAYDLDLQKMFKVFVDNLITGVPEPELKFERGLGYLREARKRIFALLDKLDREQP